MAEDKDASLVCLNGHMINNRTHSLPESNKNFCSDCGEPTISSCPNCNTDIPGATKVIRQQTLSDLLVDGPKVLIWSDEPTKPSAHCHKCGKPYPWTEREKIKAAEREIDSLKDLTNDEKKKLKADIPNIMHDSPRSKEACSLFKSVLGKLSGMARDIFVEVVSDIASETIKKSMGL